MVNWYWDRGDFLHEWIFRCNGPETFPLRKEESGENALREQRERDEKGFEHPCGMNLSESKISESNEVDNTGKKGR